MQRYTRRDFMQMGSALAAGLGLTAGNQNIIAQGLEKLTSGKTKVLWLQGMSCTGCSVSFLNSEDPGPLEILTQIISLSYHPNLSAAQGELAGQTIDKVVEDEDFLLVFEGSVPMDMPEACVIGTRPLVELLPAVLKKAKAIVAAGTCASFGGIPAAEGNPTGAASLLDFMRREHIKVDNRLVHCPGCPSHPQSLLGTIAYLAAKGYPHVDPELFTPMMFFSHSVHDDCPKFHNWEKRHFAEHFGEDGCLFKLGCLGPLSRTSCPQRQWNGGANWCIRAGAPCTACTSPDFGRRRDFPFYRKGEEVHAVAYRDEDRKAVQS